jgi:signal transduction histidine kinase
LVAADVVFLQEIHGEHKGHQANLQDWPNEAQFEYLADSIWHHHAYGKNAVYPEGHHGNAILSKYPIKRWDNLDLTLHETPSPPGDPTLIGLAVANLLQNAIDFAPDHSTVALDVRTEGDHAVIEITDAGPGIPDFAIDRAFERFFSMPRPRTGRKSSGLGLCFVRETAHLHHGEATLTPATPTGTRATLKLPLSRH